MTSCATLAWSRRADFVFESGSVPGRTHAKDPQDGPVLLIDHGDNCGAGGVTDVMDVLEES